MSRAGGSAVVRWTAFRSAVGKWLPVLTAAAFAVLAGGSTASADHGGAAHSPGDSSRVFELVSPPYKLSGNGVGVPTGDAGVDGELTGPEQAYDAGSGAYVGERFAIGGHLGAMLLDSPFATASDWALADRVDDVVGWRSHSPVTHPFRAQENYRMMQLQAASRDLSTLMWSGNAGDLPFFEEMGALGAVSDGSSLISDWGSPPESPTRWEPIGPLEASQRVGSLAGAAKVFLGPAISEDGSHLAVAGPVRGLAGSDDPTLDTATGSFGGVPKSAYLDDVSAGLSDSWPGAGVRKPAAVCTGQDGGPGLARTRIPVRNGDGSLGEAVCALKAANRNSRLVSSYGSVFAWQSPDVSEIGTSTTNVISSDGSRAFFMAPDPTLSIFDYAPDCEESGVGTKCPPQLYVRQRNLDGEVVTRWISRPEAGLLDNPLQASLLGAAYFEGASADGARVFFRTATPLTADDPNGAGQTPANPNPAAQRGSRSWDLYMFELAPGPDGDRATPDGDPTGPGSQLTRISAGPSGTADCSTQPNGVGAALRFSSQDAQRVYFSCAAPLGGVADRTTGTAGGTQGGTPAETQQSNVYLYDIAEDRYTFVARIPREGSVGESTNETLVRCSSTAALRGKNTIGPVNSWGVSSATTCWRGTDDGSFAVFWSLGRLTADDPDEFPPGSVTGGSADIYAYDADSDELVRVSAPQGSVDETYSCGNPLAGTVCYADLGMHATGNDPDVANPLVNVVSDPGSGSGRILFFESESRLVNDGPEGPMADDENDVFDVYQWRDGALSLVSSGAAGSDGTTYKGNSADGRNVYLATRDRLSWQDVDAVLDIYTARVDGGIAEPSAPPVCAVLANACGSGGDAGSTGSVVRTGAGAGGDVGAGVRRRIAIGRFGVQARRRAARSGVLAVRVRVNQPGVVRLAAKAKIGRRSVRVAGARKRIARAGSATVRLRLNQRAKSVLSQGRVLVVTVRVAQVGARSRTATVGLQRGDR